MYFFLQVVIRTFKTHDFMTGVPAVPGKVGNYYISIREWSGIKQFLEAEENRCKINTKCFTGHIPRGHQQNGGRDFDCQRDLQSLVRPHSQTTRHNWVGVRLLASMHFEGGMSRIMLRRHHSDHAIVWCAENYVVLHFLSVGGKYM